VQAASSAVLVVLAAAAEDGSLQAATGATDFVFQKNPQNQKQKSTKSECKIGLFVLGCSKSLQLKKKMQRIRSEAQKVWRVVVVVVVVQIYAPV